MLTNLDRELFPDDCEVVEMPLHNLYIYRILKNGSSTLKQEADAYGYKTWHNEEISSLNHIDIFLRNPVDRYLNGVDVFCRTINQDNPELDDQTMIWMATRYLFINRHYMTQFHWILNLVRFAGRDRVLRFHDFCDFSKITDRNNKSFRIPLDDQRKKMIMEQTSNLEFWFLLDKILLGLIGQELSWAQILPIFRNHPIDPLKIIEHPAKELLDVLR